MKPNIENLDIPNCNLCLGKDKHGNFIEALVPFGADEHEHFQAIHGDDWDGEGLQGKGIVFASTIRALLAHRNQSTP